MLKDIFANARILICVGSGGVGKTTVSACLGYMAALKGQKVLVLTIDPSQRLKTTFNLSESGEIIQVQDAALAKAQGQLHAGVINAKKTFDDFVKKAAVKEEVAKRVLNNKLYVQLSTTLSGSQEFTALEKLLSEHDSAKYDLIILDTPPSKHAIDFLRAPQKLSALFNEGIAKWFRDPKGQKQNFLLNLLHVSTKQVLKALESLTGSEFMHQLADFFTHIQSWQSQLEERISSVHRLLVHPQTQFILVSSFDHAKLKEAEFFSREIAKDGYQLSTVIMNRSFPIWLNLKETAKTQAADINHSPLNILYSDLRKYYLSRDQMYSEFSKRISGTKLVLRLPDLDEDIANLQDVAYFSSIIERELGK